MPGALFFNGTGVGSKPAILAGNAGGTEQWATEGNGTSVQGSIVDQDTCNKGFGEISAAIQAFFALDMANPNQLATILMTHGFASIGSGAGNFVVPTGISVLRVRMWGGGAGGGYGGAGAADGGSGGGYGEQLLYVASGQISPTQMIYYSIAGNAAGGTSSSPIGTDGAASIFGVGVTPGPYMTCNGGLGGPAGVAGGSPMSRSSSTAGQVSIPLGGFAQQGGYGHKGDAFTASGRTGAGGGSFGVAGAAEQLANATFAGNPAPGTGPGAGGAGGGIGLNGGAGFGGILLIDW